jgi:predicted DNA-binding transcriptional regulator AlpA
MRGSTMTQIDLQSSTAAAASVATAQPSDDLLDINAVCAFFGGTKPLHPETIYRGLGTRYPRPVRVSANVNRWLRSECEAALRTIMEAPREPLTSPRYRGANAA